MRISKKILAGVLAALLAISMMPFTAFAATTYEVSTAAELEEAIANVSAGDTIKLLDDITLAGNTVSGESAKYGAYITESITVDGSGHTVTGKAGTRAFGVKGVSEDVSVTFKDITISVNSNTGGAICICTRGGIDTLTLDHVTLDTPGSGQPYNQPLTIGGTQYTQAKVNVINNSVIQTSNDGSKYYAIILWNPVDLTIEDSVIKGWACVYQKTFEAGTVDETTVTINNSQLISKGIAGNTNEFAAIMTEESRFSCVVTNSDIDVTAAEGTLQGIASSDGESDGFSVELGDGNDVTLTGDAAVVGYNFDDENKEISVSGGTFNKPVDAAYCADGYIPADNGGSYGVDGPYVAVIGTTGYATLEAAVEASNEGDTITLIDDVHLEGKYGRSTAGYIFNLKNRTLDLNGKTITMYNHEAGFAGDNMVIKNGTFTCVPTSTNVKTSYALPIYPEEFTRQGATSADLNTVTNKSTGVVLEDLVLNPGGLNIKGAEVTCKNLDVTGSYYYGVYAQFDAVVNIESGNYTVEDSTLAIIFAADKTDGTPKIDDYTVFNITGGNFSLGTSAKMFNKTTRDDHYVVSGGKFTKADTTAFEVPENYIAEGYVQDMTTGRVNKKAEDTMSITVEDNIDLNINLDTSSDDAETIEYTYTNPNREDAEDIQTVTKSAKGDVTSFTVNLAPAQIKDDITATVKDKDGEAIRTVTTSISDYCNTIITTAEANPDAFGAKTAQLADLAKSTLDYGKAAAEFFNYNKTAYTGDYILGDPATEIQSLASSAAQTYFDSNRIHISSVSYRATTVPELRFYITENLRDQSFLADLILSSNVGKAEFVKTADGAAMLRISGIDIQDFNTNIIVKCKIDEYANEETLLEFTPILWVNAAIKSTSYTELSNLGKTIGNYYLKSVGYFQNN